MKYSVVLLRRSLFEMVEVLPGILLSEEMEMEVEDERGGEVQVGEVQVGEVLGEVEGDEV